jgi:hypothetical protein
MNVDPTQVLVLFAQYSGTYSLTYPNPKAALFMLLFSLHTIHICRHLILNHIHFYFSPLS